MATSMAAAIAASMPEKQAAPSSAPTTVATHEAIPASMAKVMDVEAEIPLTSVELDGLVSVEQVILMRCVVEIWWGRS